MDYQITHSALGTHIDWALDGVTASQIDWFWSNMEKGFILWHPEQHEPLSWPVPPVHGNPLGAIHNAPQTWDDGRRQDLYIRFERLEDLPDPVRAAICHSHVIAVSGLGFNEASMQDPEPLGYRLHQWSPSDSGVVGKSTAIGARKPETEADEAKTGVEAAAIRGAHVATEADPGTTPQNAPLASLRAGGVGYRTLGIVSIPVLAPFPNITVHFVQTPGIGGQ